MTLVAQLRALLAAIASPGRVRGRTIGWILVFLLAAAAIVALTAHELYGRKDELLEAALAFVLRPRWVPVGRAVVEGLWAQKLDAVLVNAVIGGSLFLLSTVLLPIRERVSIAFERDNHLTDDPEQPTPILHFVLDIIVAVLVFVTAQLVIFSIGYSRDPARRALASTLSYFFLFASCAMDLLPPLLLRHGLRNSAALAALGRHPLLSLAFGALFSAPGLIVASLAVRAPAGQRIVAIVGANVLAVLWGTLAGTIAGARLYEDARNRPPPSLLTRMIAWVLLLGAFGWYSYAAGATALALEQKSQLLKCRFHLVASSIGVDLPDLGALLHAKVSTKAHATIEITNPTEREVVFEDSRLEIERGGATVARVALNAGRIPAGHTTPYPIEAPVVLSAHELKRALHDAGQWTVTLYVQVAPGVELPIFIKDPK